MHPTYPSDTALREAYMTREDFDALERSTSMPRLKYIKYFEGLYGFSYERSDKQVTFTFELGSDMMQKGLLWCAGHGEMRVNLAALNSVYTITITPTTHAVHTVLLKLMNEDEQILGEVTADSAYIRAMYQIPNPSPKPITQ